MDQNLQYLYTFLNFYDNLVFFDFETSGFSPVLDDIIEIGAIQVKKIDDKLVFGELSVLVKLNKKTFLPPKIIEITNITDQMLKEEGILIDDAREELYKMMSDGEKTLVIAHNAAFDLGFLVQLFSTDLHKDVLNKINVLDTLTVFKDRKGYPHKLSDGIDYYNLGDIVQNSHRALADVKSLVYLMVAMEKERPDVLEYVNLIGYNPKYPPKSIRGLNKIEILPQPYSSIIPLYKRRKAA